MERINAVRRVLRLFVLLSFVTAACGAPATNSSDNPETPLEAGRTIKVATVPKLLGIAAFEENRRCGQEVAKDLNIEMEYNAPVKAEAQGQVQIFSSLIARRFDVIMTSANSPTELAPTLKRAMEQGIKVVTYDSDVIPEARDFYIGNADAQALAEAQIDAVVKALGTDNPEAEIAILSSTPTATIQLDWIKRMTEYMQQKYPGLKVVTTEYGYSDLSKSLTAGLNILRAHPQVKAIIGPDALAAAGAAAAVEKLGLQGQVYVTGISNPSTIREAINNGTVQEVFFWDECLQGKLHMYVARLAADDQLPTGPGMIETPLGTYEVDANRAIVCCPVLTITRDNVNSYTW